MDREVFTGTIQAFRRRNPYRPFAEQTQRISRESIIVRA